MGKDGKSGARGWIKYVPGGPVQLPNEPACYVVYLDGVLAYIGSTSDIRKRLQTYNIRPGYGGGDITPWGQCAHVYIKIAYSRKYGDWAMRELRLIRRLQPPMNCIGSTKRRSLSHG